MVGAENGMVLPELGQGLPAGGLRVPVPGQAAADLRLQRRPSELAEGVVSAEAGLVLPGRVPGLPRCVCVKREAVVSAWSCAESQLHEHGVTRPVLPVKSGSGEEFANPCSTNVLLPLP
mmetsp:Transcript_53862/g.136019  ORF Transcript_53862/g.136019 Transcript_53862/m.136019 type:complete len:119 (+) Transcript_53862:326-682(+)